MSGNSSRPPSQRSRTIAVRTAGVGALVVSMVVGLWQWGQIHCEGRLAVVCGGQMPRQTVCDPLPGGPFDGQLTPKDGCPAKTRAKNGGCWIQVEMTPPCTPFITFEDGGRCWVPAWDPKHKQPVVPNSQGR